MDGFKNWHMKRFMEEDSIGSLSIPSAIASPAKFSSSLNSDFKEMEKNIEHEGGVDNKKSLLVQFVKQADYQDEGVKTAKQQLIDDFKWVLKHLTEGLYHSDTKNQNKTIDI